MGVSEELTVEQRVRKVESLIETAETAYALARQLNEQLWQMRTWEQGGRMTAVAYSLGICLGDVEIAASRLGGLRNELNELQETLRRQREDEDGTASQSRETARKQGAA